MKVPLLDLTYREDGLKENMLAAIREVVESQKFIMGPQVQEFESRVAQYCNVKHAVGVSSGTDALLVSLMALDVGYGDEVVTTPYSFFATAGAIARLGARPVFVDIDPVTYNMDPRQIAGVISSKTKAIIPVHLYGQCADMELINEVAMNKSVPVVEDAAQAIGAQYRNGQSAGSMGALGCFSFFPSKNLGAIGDAGLVVTNDSSIAEKIRVLRVHGSKPKYYHQFVGGNFRLDTIQAAVLNVRLNFLDSWTKQRQENAERYAQYFSSSNLLNDKFISLPLPIYKSAGVDRYHIYNQFVIRAKDREGLRRFLESQHIGSEVYYPVPLHLQECFRSLGLKIGDFPESERASQQTLALPIYPGLTAEMQRFVVDKISEFYLKGTKT